MFMVHDMIAVAFGFWFVTIIFALMGKPLATGLVGLGAIVFTELACTYYRRAKSWE